VVADGGVVEEVAKAALALAQCFVGGLLRTDVATDAQRADDAAVAIAIRSPGGEVRPLDAGLVGGREFVSVLPVARICLLEDRPAESPSIKSSFDAPMICGWSRPSHRRRIHHQVAMVQILDEDRVGRASIKPASGDFLERRGHVMKDPVGSASRRARSSGPVPCPPPG
jgi:hypothetical protein